MDSLDSQPLDNQPLIDTPVPETILAADAALITEPTSVPPPPSTARYIFFGRFGLRAGWGMAIFIAVCAILVVIGGFTAVAVSGHLHEIIAAKMQAKAHPNAPPVHVNIPFTAGLVTVNDGVNFLGMLLLCFFFSKGERRPLGSYGIGKNRLADFLPGAFWGLAALSVLVFVLHSFHLLYFDARLLYGGPMFVYAIKWLIAFLFVGFSEEYQLRGYLQYTLTRGVYGLGEDVSPQRAHLIAFWIAAIIMSLLFGALHLGNTGENALGISQVVLVGLIFSYALWRTGSLWWGIGFHMAWDWAQSFLYGVADSGNLSVGRLFQTHIAGKPILSGGPDGPEGSVFCVPVLLLILLVIRFTTKPGNQPPLERLPASDTVPEAPPLIA